MKKKILTKKVIKAIKASITHWRKDIIQKFKDGYSIGVDTPQKFPYSVETAMMWNNGELVECYTDSCPLCKINTYKNLVTNCEACVLGDCESYGSTWQKFRNNPCLLTAEAMVTRLESLLPEEKK